MMNKEILDELNAISPLLAKKGRISDGYKIPDGYFEQMTRQVMEQVSLMPQPEFAKKRRSFLTGVIEWFDLHRSAAPRFGIAMAVVICLAAGALWRTRTADPISGNTAVVNQNVAIHQYIAAHPDEFDDEFILESQGGKYADNASAGEEKNAKLNGSSLTEKDDLEKMLREELQDEALDGGKL